MRTGFAIAALLASAALPSAANAAINITGISGDPGFRTGVINYTGSGGALPNNQSSVAVSVGRIKLTGTDTTTNASVGFLAYCIDIFDYLKAGLFDIADFSFDPGKEEKLKVLMTNTAGAIDAVDATALTNAQKIEQKRNVSSAIQMAVWEVAFETAGNPYSIMGGDFWMNGSGLTGLNGGISSAQTLAQGFLNNLNTNAWSQVDPNWTLKMLVPQDAANNQTQAFLVSTPVPEPSTWALLILGFGLVGHALRGRRTATVRYA
jgi:hypothetical protein